MLMFSGTYLSIRFVQDWDVDLVISFYDVLYSLRLRQGGENSS